MDCDLILNMKNIVIIGAGQLGSRHLQALARVKEVINISVVDPSLDSLKTAEARFDEVRATFKGNVNYFTEIESLEENNDIVIIATNSIIRRDVIQRLVKTKSVKYLILEKFLFANQDDYDFVENLLLDKGIKTWVNCPRRMYDIYKDLKLKIKSPASFSAEGSNWGLGCNSIHLLDIFSYLVGNENFSDNRVLLDEEILKSKRDGYIEFTGEICLWTEKKDSFRIKSYNEGSKPIRIRIETLEGIWILDELKGEILYWGEDSEWKCEASNYKSPFQSGLTNIAVEEILASGSCELTPLDESTKLHKVLFEIFLNHYNSQNQEQNNKICAIT